MSLPVKFDDEALDEFKAAVRWYDSKSRGLGTRFAGVVEESIDRIAANPKLHAVVYFDIRKAVVFGFPYCVFYIPDTTHVRIVSVFHTSRDPAIWKGRR